MVKNHGAPNVVKNHGSRKTCAQQKHLSFAKSTGVLGQFVNVWNTTGDEWNAKQIALKSLDEVFCADPSALKTESYQNITAVVDILIAAMGNSRTTLAIAAVQGRY